MPPNSYLNLADLGDLVPQTEQKIRVAILGCGMMGQEHISYISGYDDLQIDFLCDPHEPSLETSLKVLEDFHSSSNSLTTSPPTLFNDEKDLLARASEIDLLVIASPNYLHTSSLTQWGLHDLTILVEKPVAVSAEQVATLRRLRDSPEFCARVWVAMEYRYIPAIAKLLELLPTIGDLRMVTIRENRYPFLHKIGAWNRDRAKTGDTLVEKCCHFFDLFRLITGKENRNGRGVQAIAQRGINYHHEEFQYEQPILDSAFVVMPLQSHQEQQQREAKMTSPTTMACLELCMFAEGSRHQEEVIVTGTKGRLEAYLPENKVYSFRRPNLEEWQDRSVPPPESSIHEEVFDCSDVKDVHGIDTDMPTHGGYHYSSTAVEWYHLIQTMDRFRHTGQWRPQVSLTDGIRAVELGLSATEALGKTEKETVGI